jgi:hypothetical protein
MTDRIAMRIRTRKMDDVAPTAMMLTMAAKTARTIMDYLSKERDCEKLAWITHVSGSNVTMG